MNDPEAIRTPVRGALLRVLGKAFAVSAAIGTTIGGGILYTPGKIAALLPDARWILGIWAFGGLNALLGATVFAELGAMIPRSGGPYPFARRALGEYAAFVVGYTQWILDCAANAALLLLVGEYTVVMLPTLRSTAVAIAFGALIVLTALNWRGVRGGGWIQVTTTLAKTVALGGVAAAAFWMRRVAPGAAAPAGPHGLGWIIPSILAMQGVIFTYDSYYAPIFFGEELRDPGREIPRAIFRGLAVIIPIYLLLNAAFLRVLPIARMANESFVGGAAAQVLFGPHGDQIIRTIVIVSVLGTCNALMLVTARVLLAMGRDGLFARQAMRVNPGGTPTVALLLSTIVAGAFLASGTFNAVLAVVSLLMAVNYLLVFVSLVVLRIKEPRTARPYRAWGYPWTTGAAILIGIVFVFGVALSDPFHSAIALGLLLGSYPLYRGTRRLFQSGAPAG
ncbi:MAG TPA: APC family permease [Steroidobacteraceae bacterium]|nr:APC family permease [Steroidobacteraceae bacterium]